jgi:hypothetical protein
MAARNLVGLEEKRSASQERFITSAEADVFYDAAMKTSNRLPDAQDRTNSSPNTGKPSAKAPYNDLREAKSALKYYLHGASKALEKSGEVTNKEYDWSMQFAREAAEHIVESCSGSSEELIERVKKEIEDSKSDGFIPTCVINFFRNVQIAHWTMLVPFFLALTVLGMTMYRVFTSLLFTSSNSNHIASLIPIFMILGEPILSKALAICIATPRNDSPHFGCGWLSWSLSALLPALSGTRDLLPKPEVDCKVLNLKSGQGRQNNSFVLSRVLRDLESEYEPKAGGLTIEILDTVKPTAPLSRADVFVQNSWTFIIMGTQLLIAVHAFLKFRDESIILIFGTAIFLMEAIVNMPVWRASKFSARKGKGSTYALMRGNGHRHVFIIRNMHEEASNIEDLAVGGSAQYDYCRTFEAHVLIWTFLSFLALTVLSTCLSDQSALYILIIMTLGTVGNVMHAAIPRALWMHGIALRSVETIFNDKNVMGAIQALEEKYEGLGEPLVAEIFSGGLTEEQKEWWVAGKERKLQK